MQLQENELIKFIQSFGTRSPDNVLIIPNHRRPQNLLIHNQLVLDLIDKVPTNTAFPCNFVEVGLHILLSCPPVHCSHFQLFCISIRFPADINAIILIDKRPLFSSKLLS